MSSVSSEAFIYWFVSKYDAKEIDENLYAMSIDVAGKKMPTFLNVWDDMWSVSCPILSLDKKAKQNLFEHVYKHSGQSAMGITIIDDMLCIVNCSTNFNAPEAEDWILSFAGHAAALLG